MIQKHLHFSNLPQLRPRWWKGIRALQKRHQYFLFV